MSTQVSEVVLKGLHELTKKLVAAEDTDWVLIIEDLEGVPVAKVVSTANLLANFDDTALLAAIALKADKTNVLELDNVASYTPTLDYHPATVKFVQDTLVNLGAGDVVGPASAGSQNVPVFNGTTGKLIADSSRPISSVPSLLTNQLWSRPQYYDEYVLDENLFILWEPNTNPCASVTLTVDGNTVTNPSLSLLAGATYVLRVVQDTNGGNDLYFGNKFKWPNGTKPVMTSAGNAVDILTFYSDGNFLYGVRSPNFS